MVDYLVVRQPAQVAVEDLISAQRNQVLAAFPVQQQGQVALPELVSPVLASLNLVFERVLVVTQVAYTPQCPVGNRGLA